MNRREKRMLLSYYKRLHAFDQSKATTNIKIIHSVCDFTPLSSNLSAFLDPMIQDYINREMRFLHSFHFKPHIQLYIASKTRVPPSKTAHKMIHIIRALRHLFRKTDCAQTIYYYPTPFKKVAPVHTSALSPKEVNSGLTFLESPAHHDHKNGDIILFRTEEVYKVLIHELIHSFHLDYALVMNSVKLKSDVCSNYPILLNEAYTEALTTLLQFYWLSNDPLNGKSISTLYDAELKYELALAKYILKRAHMKPADLHLFVKDNGVCKRVFEQYTNVFSYYILKPLLLLHIDFFESFIRKYTKHGSVQKDDVHILEDFIFNELRNPKSRFISALEAVGERKSRSLKMVSKSIS